jgi:hypothetical protein
MQESGIKRSQTRRRRQNLRKGFGSFAART